MAQEMTRRRIASGGLLIASGVTLAACSGLGDQALPATTKATGKIVHAVPGNPNEMIPRQAQADAFNKQFGPTLRVEFIVLGGTVTVPVLLASDTPPDTYGGGAVNVPTNVVKNEVLDLTPLIKRDKVNLNDFFPALIKAWSYQGKQVAFNDFWDTTVLYVNRDLYKRAGLKIPDAALTFDQWLTDAKKMTRADPDKPVWGGFHSTNLPNIFIAIWQWGGDVFSADGKKCLLNSPEAVAAVQWIADMWNKHDASPPPSYTSQTGQGWVQLFTGGRIGSGMDANGIDSARTFMGATGLDWQALAIPKAAKGRANWMFANTTVIPSSAKNPEGGWAWLKFVSSPEGYDARGATESYRSVRLSRASSTRLMSQPWLSDRGVVQAWKDSEATLHQPPQVPNYATITGEITKVLGVIWSGEKSAKQAMEELVPSINGMLAQN